MLRIKIFIVLWRLRYAEQLIIILFYFIFKLFTQKEVLL